MLFLVKKPEMTRLDRISLGSEKSKGRGLNVEAADADFLLGDGYL